MAIWTQAPSVFPPEVAPLVTILSTLVVLWAVREWRRGR